ncbi:hypothetical protein BGZ51_002010, partial [Haplosporangium sp. Z 767]
MLDGGADVMRRQLIFPPDPQVFLNLQPARDDGGCVVCLQASDSPGNQIVLCDNCDRGFHQLCYSPYIDNKYVEIAELGWTCYACDLPLSTTSSLGLSALTEDMSLTGQQVPQRIKASYLRSLSKANLVKLISRIENNTPSVKLYPSRLSSPLTAQPDQTSFTSSGIADARVPASGVQLEPSQDMTFSPANQAVQGIQVDYFDTPVSHFRPTLDSPLSNLQQPAASGDGRSVQSQGSLVVKSTYGPHGNGDPLIITGSAIIPNQPTIHSAPRHVGRQTPRSGSGAGATSEYHSVKAQDLPPYEEMIFKAIAELKEAEGSAPKSILDWVQAHYPVPESFRASCGQAISKAAKKGRLLKEGALYKLKPGYNYPKRTSRPSNVAARARSQSHNSALALGIPMTDRPPQDNSMGVPYDQINSIIDANLYGMLPSPTFHVQPQAIGAASAFSGAMTINSHQNVQSLKFDSRSLGQVLETPQLTSIQTATNINMDVKEGRVNVAGGLVGLGASNPSSGNTSENDFGVDSETGGSRSSSASMVLSAQPPFNGSLQSAGAFPTTAMQTPRSQQLPQAFVYDPTWIINAATSTQSQGGLVGAASIQQQQSNMYSGQIIQGRAGTMSAPLQFATPSFGSFGSLTISSHLPQHQQQKQQQLLSQQHSTFQQPSPM